MGCVLRVSGTESAIQEVLRDPVFSSIAVVPVRVRGENRTQTSANIEVSSAGLNDLPGQIVDALVFLSTYGSKIESCRRSGIQEVVLDFGVEWKSGMASQTHTLPADLVSLAATLRAAIQVSHYAVRGRRQRDLQSD